MLLEVRGLRGRGRLADISFQLRAGEILGLAGMVGSGRNLLARCLLGLEPHDAGEIAPARDRAMRPAASARP